jgi:hypothetical protein
MVVCARSHRVRPAHAKKTSGYAACRLNLLSLRIDKYEQGSDRAGLIHAFDRN